MAHLSQSTGAIELTRFSSHHRFHPGYLTAERLAKAKKLKLAVTAGIGSDHVDLNAANKTNGGVTVAEVTGSNVVSVAEHVIMTILTLVRNFVPAHEQIERGEWDVAAVAKNEYDLENKVVGTVAVGRIGERVLRRLKPFDCKELLYFDYQPLKPEVEKEIGCRRCDTLEEMLEQCDVVTINCPLHEKTRGLFNKALISKMKKGKSHLGCHLNNLPCFVPITRYLPLSSTCCAPFLFYPIPFPWLKHISYHRLISTNISLPHQAPGSSTPPAAPSSSKKTSPKPSNPATSAATAETSGSRNPPPRTIPSARPRTPSAAGTPWFPTCRAHPSMRRSVMPRAQRLY